MLKIRVGADPEAFISSSYSNREDYIWPNSTTLPGTKHQPFIVKDGAIQIDGLAAEWNIDPADNETEFTTRLKSVFSEITKRYGWGTKVKIVPVAEFLPQNIKYLPRPVVELGCVPDYNAYTEDQNPSPKLPDNDPYKQLLRAAGGHLHLGWTEGVDVNDPNHRKDCWEVVKQLDFYLGLPSLYWDKDNRRRELYGKAGACRVKPYGVEYRTLSNQWLRGLQDKSEEDLMGFVYRQAVKAIRDLEDGKKAYNRHGMSARNMIDGIGKETYNALLYKTYFPELPERYLPKEDKVVESPLLKKPRKKKPETLDGDF